MQRAAGFAFHRLRHERRVNAVLQRRFARDAFEQEHLIGEFERIAVQEVDFELTGTVFVRQRVGIDFHRFAIVVDVFDDRIEFVHRVDAVRTTRSFFATRAPDRRLERVVRVLVLLHEIELDFGRDDRLPAFVRIHFQDALEHLTRRVFERHHALPITVDDHARGRLRRPRHRAHGVEVRHQQQIAIDVEAIVVDIAVVAGHALNEDRFRYTQVVLQELAGRKKLAARDAGNVGNDCFDFVDFVFDQPLFGITRHNSRRFAIHLCSLQGNGIDPNVPDANTSRFAQSVAKTSDVSEFLLRGDRTYAAAAAAVRRTVRARRRVHHRRGIHRTIDGAASRAARRKAS